MENLTYQTFDYNNETYAVAKQIVYGGKTYLLSVKVNKEKDDIEEVTCLFELTIENGVKSVRLENDTDVCKKISDYIINSINN